MLTFAEIFNCVKPGKSRAAAITRKPKVTMILLLLIFAVAAAAGCSNIGTDPTSEATELSAETSAPEETFPPVQEADSAITNMT